MKGEITGILPSSSWKKERFGKPWLQGETPSIGIGQGYNTFTIMQMAKAISIIANRGKVVTPRLIKSSQDQQTGEITIEKSSLDIPRGIQFIYSSIIRSPIRQTLNFFKDSK